MNSIYLNNAFAKRPLQRVVDAMQPFLRDSYENPLTESSGGDEAREVLARARSAVAGLLNADPEEIIFVSSGTEANNWALKGAVSASRNKAKHIVISAIEHFSVYQTAQYLQKQGVEVTIVPVDSEGHVEPAEVARAITPDTVIVSILAGSDEIGVIQDLEKLSHLKHRHPQTLFHTDAIQYLCYESLDVCSMPFDLVSLSSNALYGPAGIAALFVRKMTRLTPLLHGGMQENGMRPGLQSLPLVAGFGSAASINAAEKGAWKTRVAEWREDVLSLCSRLNVPITGSRESRLVDNIHGIVDVDGEALLTLLQDDEIFASTGSTCSQYAQKESHVLKGVGISQEQARGAILLTGSIYIEENDRCRFSAAFEEALNSLRALKPW